MKLPAPNDAAIIISKFKIIFTTAAIIWYPLHINQHNLPAGPADVPSAFKGQTQRHDGPHPDLNVPLLFS
jgi:hypothetical protein